MRSLERWAIGMGLFFWRRHLITIRIDVRHRRREAARRDAA